MERLRKGDMVEVRSGKEKGKRGRILKILRKKQRVIIERLMIVKRHTKPSQKSPQGGILEKEGSIHLSNVMPIDPGTDKPTRIKTVSRAEGRFRVGKSGTLIEAQK